jgi:hypothetical protein
MYLFADVGVDRVSETLVSAISALCKLKTAAFGRARTLGTIFLIAIRILRHPGVLERPTDYEASSYSISFTMATNWKGLGNGFLFFVSQITQPTRRCLVQGAQLASNNSPNRRFTAGQIRSPLDVRR